MYQKIFLAFSLTLGLCNCEDTGPVTNITNCIQANIQHNPPNCGQGAATTVDENLFQNQLVYVFDYSSCCCDYPSYVLNATCDTLGYLHGFAGNYTINEESFANAVFQRTLWP